MVCAGDVTPAMLARGGCRLGAMRFGFHFMDFNLPDGPASYAPALRDTARAAEACGASWFTVMDHYFQMEFFRTAHDPMLEAYTTLGYVAAVTERMKLGTVVTGVTFRHPGLLAKIGSTLDVLSEGRAFLGIGAAWYEREHLALGVPTRRSRSASSASRRPCRSSTRCGARTRARTTARTTTSPRRSTSRRRSRSRTRRSSSAAAARRRRCGSSRSTADATNLIVDGADTLQHKLEVLRGHCDALGRDYDTIEKTVMGPQLDPLDDVDGFLAVAESYAALGVEHIHLRAVTPTRRPTSSASASRSPPASPRSDRSTGDDQLDDRPSAATTMPEPTTFSVPTDGETVRRHDRDHVFHAWGLAGADTMSVARTEGSWIWDTEGRRYLDFTSQLVNANLGHQHPRMVAAIQEQAGRMATLGPAYSVDVRSEAARLVAERTPGDLDMVFFTTGGSEANENAIRMARVHTGRHKVLSAYRSYHGGTAGSMAATGEPRRWATEPGMPGVVHFWGPYPYARRSTPRAPSRSASAPCSTFATSSWSRVRRASPRSCSRRSSAPTASSCRRTATCRACATCATSTGSS